MNSLTIEDIEHLDEKGYVVKENFFSKIDAHNLTYHTRRLLSLLSGPEFEEALSSHVWAVEVDAKTTRKNFFTIQSSEFGRVFYNDHNVITRHPPSAPQDEINKFNATYIENRGSRGWDKGMYVITYPTKPDPLCKFNGLKLPDVEPIVELLSKFYKDEYHLASLKVYVNDSIKNTRDFHRDTTEKTPRNKKMKAFVYLTHVFDIDSGPYSYIEGTHKDYNLKESDGPEKVFLGPAGTLILSNQNGLHRGQPQQQDRSRVVLVFNLFTK